MYNNANVFGDQCLGRTRCYDRFKRFKNGRTSVDDGSERPFDGQLTVLT